MKEYCVVCKSKFEEPPFWSNLAPSLYAPTWGASWLVNMNAKVSACVGCYNAMSKCDKCKNRTFVDDTQKCIKCDYTYCSECSTQLVSEQLSCEKKNKCDECAQNKINSSQNSNLMILFLFFIFIIFLSTNLTS